MKKVFKNQFGLFIMLCVMVMATQSSCKKQENEKPPVINRIRAIAPAPNDSTLTKVGSGQNIVIQGANLKSASAVYFSGFPATFNAALVGDNNFVVTVPSILFSNIPKGQENTIRLVSKYGETIFKFPVSPPPPIVNSVSNEYTLPGQTITLYGQYLYLITNITFPGGADGTNVVSKPDGTSCTVTIPLGATSGDIIVKTQGGSTKYSSYNDQVTGMLCNFDNVNTFSYGSTRTNDQTLFPGAQGFYARMFTGPISSFNYAWYDANRSINLNPVQWVPLANLQDPVASYVLKFEIFVKEPWGGGGLMIRRDEGTWLYLARYEPWKATLPTPFTSNQWYTVTIPLTQFKTKTNNGEGTGNSVPTLADLTNSTGRRPMVFMYINDTSTPVTTKFDVAIDNIRIVKANR
ncbi:hypothetical protein EZ428_08525 [Pedobacter frigiditerrae]|uniref:Surface glycan-binding protein B xyloglucan binding domain-containing protein n=1 Tax=Pedobacter frigiditerrae TaxID=2530452 RepID=A0A4R0MY08_9SPHI|nr:glycan-binding surface protein [Pedobacter frigiditerrae]TCC91787.1 hypothetical protein EZ428_08525 [Pedobacter frigiditerrae]